MCPPIHPSPCPSLPASLPLSPWWLLWPDTSAFSALWHGIKERGSFLTKHSDAFEMVGWCYIHNNAQCQKKFHHRKIACLALCLLTSLLKNLMLYIIWNAISKKQEKKTMDSKGPAVSFRLPVRLPENSRFRPLFAASRNGAYFPPPGQCCGCFCCTLGREQTKWGAQFPVVVRMKEVFVPFVTSQRNEFNSGLLFSRSVLVLF